MIVSFDFRECSILSDVIYSQNYKSMNDIIIAQRILKKISPVRNDEYIKKHGIEPIYKDDEEGRKQIIGFSCKTDGKEEIELNDIEISFIKNVFINLEKKEKLKLEYADIIEKLGIVQI